MQMQAKALHELFSQDQVRERISDIARKLNQDYAGTQTVMVCVLKGAFMFFSDLLKEITFSPEIDFVRLSSYGKSDTSSGEVVITKDIETSVSGKDVLAVEDVVDSGLSMLFLQKHLLSKGAKTLRIIALVDKVERRKTDIDVAYAGFSLQDGFIVGYGLDYAERFRELPAIYTVEFEK